DSEKNHPLTSVRNFLLLSTESTRDRYHCDEQLGWTKELLPNAVIQTFCSPTEVNHFNVIANKEALDQIFKMLSSWNRDNHIDQWYLIFESFFSLSRDPSILNNSENKLYLQNFLANSVFSGLLVEDGKKHLNVAHQKNVTTLSNE